MLLVPRYLRIFALACRTIGPASVGARYSEEEKDLNVTLLSQCTGAGFHRLPVRQEQSGRNLG